MSRSVHVLAQAKVNLTLELLGRRADGFHELRSVFATVELADLVRVATSTRLDVRLTPDVGVPAGDDSRAARSARSLRPPSASRARSCACVSGSRSQPGSAAVRATRVRSCARSRRSGTFRSPRRRRPQASGPMCPSSPRERRWPSWAGAGRPSSRCLLLQRSSGSCSCAPPRRCGRLRCSRDTGRHRVMVPRVSVWRQRSGPAALRRPCFATARATSCSMQPSGPAAGSPMRGPPRAPGVSSSICQGADHRSLRSPTIGPRRCASPARSAVPACDPRRPVARSCRDARHESALRAQASERCSLTLEAWKIQRET